jgi:hypothetical protein
MAKLSFILALFVSKTQTDIQHIEELKEKFRYLDTFVIASRLTNFSRSNNLSIAYKQILKERGIDDYLSILK